MCEKGAVTPDVSCTAACRTEDTSPPEVGPDPECQGRLRQDSAFFSRTQSRSKKFGKNWTRCQAKFLTSAKFLTCIIFQFFASQNKETKSLNYFFDVCCANQNILSRCQEPTTSYSPGITLTIENFRT